jgi:hypothetical protein
VCCPNSAAPGAGGARAAYSDGAPTVAKMLAQSCGEALGGVAKMLAQSCGEALGGLPLKVPDQDSTSRWGRRRGCPNRARLCQASAEHLEECAEFSLLRNRGLGALAVTVLPVPIARRAATTACAAV